MRDEWRHRLRASTTVRIAPGFAVAVGGALLSTFTAVGWWIAVAGVALIVVGLVWGLRRSEHQIAESACPRFPDDPERMPRGPAELFGPDHIRVAMEVQKSVMRPGTTLITGAVGSGKSALCAWVVNSVAVRRRFLHSTDGRMPEDRRFWADLSGRRPGAEVEEAIISAVGATSLAAAFDVLRDDAGTLLVLNDADEAFDWTSGDDPLLRRLSGCRGGLSLVVTARGEPGSPGLPWSSVLSTTALPLRSARELFDQLAPRFAGHRAVDELLARCDGLPLAVWIVGRAVAAAASDGDVASLASRALQGAGDAPGGRRLTFAISLSEGALDAEERYAWWALSQFPAGLSRDDLGSVLGMPLADYHVAHLYRLGLVVSAGAGLRVPIPLRRSATDDEEPLPLWQRFVDRG